MHPRSVCMALPCLAYDRGPRCPRAEATQFSWTPFNSSPKGECLQPSKGKDVGGEDSCAWGSSHQHQGRSVCALSLRGVAGSGLQRAFPAPVPPPCTEGRRRLLAACDNEHRKKSLRTHGCFPESPSTTVHSPDHLAPLTPPPSTLPP